MAEAAQEKQKMPRRYKVILGLSLALNLAVAGMLGGAALRHGDGGHGRGGLRAAGLGAYGLPYMIALPKEERRQVIRSVRSDRSGKVLNRKARRAHYNDVLTALRNAPFDPQSLAAALSLQADTTIRVQQSAQTAWLAVVGLMSDADRLAYADRVEEVLRRGLRHRK